MRIEFAMSEQELMRELGEGQEAPNWMAAWLTAPEMLGKFLLWPDPREPSADAFLVVPEFPPRVH